MTEGEFFQPKPETVQAATGFGELSEKVKLQEKEISPEIDKAAKNIIGMFNLQPKEEFVLATDQGVIKELPEMILALEKYAKEKLSPEKGHFRLLVAPKTEHSAQLWQEAIGEKLKGKPILIITSLSRSHSQETREALWPENWLSDAAKLRKLAESGNLRELVKKGWSGIREETLEKILIASSQNEIYQDIFKGLLKVILDNNRSRLVSITRGTNRELLTQGACSESLADIEQRTGRLAELMKDVEMVHIISPEGTDLWLKPRVEYAEVDNGKVDKPGKLANFPVGEWACAVGFKETKGKIVVYKSPLGPGIDREMVDEPVTIIIESGKAKEISGGKAAEILKKTMEKINREYHAALPEDKQADCYKVAEFGIGTNTKASRIVEGQKVVAPTSLEGEKLYGSVHIALGANGTFGLNPKDPEFNNIPFHNDMVLPGVTVECTKKDGTRFILIENGQAIGY